MCVCEFNVCASGVSECEFDACIDIISMMRVCLGFRCDNPGSGTV